MLSTHGTLPRYINWNTNAPRGDLLPIWRQAITWADDGHCELDKNKFKSKFEGNTKTIFPKNAFENVFLLNVFCFGQVSIW